MINTLVLCEGKFDLNFLKGVVEDLGKDLSKISFIEGPKDIIRIIREGFYNTVIFSVGGKGNLPKYAKNMISIFRSEYGDLNIIYIKDKVAGNRIAENLMRDVNEFVGNDSKFNQNKPEVLFDGNMISVAFQEVKLTYHILGIDVSLENQVWKKLRDESNRCIEINRNHDDDHDKLNEYCSHGSISIEELMKGAHEYFNGDDEWYLEIQTLFDDYL